MICGDGAHARQTIIRRRGYKTEVSDHGQRSHQGSVEHAKGMVKEAVGKAAGDAKLEVEGRNEKPPEKFRTRSAGPRCSGRVEEIIGAARALTSSQVCPRLAIFSQHPAKETLSWI